MKTKIILTCEHADFKIPEFIKNKKCFSQSLLKSHRGWDQGAYAVCKILKKQLNAELHFFSYSRLFIDANRSLNNKALSPIAQDLSESEKQQLIKKYKAYRNAIFKTIDKNVKKNIPTLLFSIHSFVPIFNKKVRRTDIGLLFRPEFKKELSLAKIIKSELLEFEPKKSLNIHFNKPYRGFTDCFSNDVLNKYIKNKNVNGLFIELNQRQLTSALKLKRVAQSITHSINQIR